MGRRLEADDAADPAQFRTRGGALVPRRVAGPPEWIPVPDDTLCRWRSGAQRTRSTGPCARGG